MDKYTYGLNKKSFQINYDGGTIWCEHLDSINDISALKEKFTQDMKILKRPSISSFVAINLDETEVDNELADFILDGLCFENKRLIKVVFVGLDGAMKRYVKRQSKKMPFVTAFIDDFEKAKYYLIHGE